MLYSLWLYITLKSFEVSWSKITAKPLLLVLRTDRPNWRGVQLRRQTNRKMTNMRNNCNCSLFHFATFVARFHQSFDCHYQITATEHFFIFSIFSFLKHFTHKNWRCFLKSRYILTDFIFLIKTLRNWKLGIFKIAFSSLGFYRLLQRQGWDVGF